MPFKCTPTEIPEVVYIQPKIFSDERGFFLESYKASDFETYGISEPIVQCNQSKSEKHVLRGLHFQRNPYAQGKIVSCLEGAIFDVAVDIRTGSPAYGKWVGRSLDGDTKNILYVPPGFAHGFCVTSDIAVVQYFCIGGEYHPESEDGIIWNDPEIGIEWPTNSPILSDKDTEYPSLSKAGEIFTYAQ